MNIDNRKPITVKEAWESYVDQPKWMYSKGAAELGLDPWTEITGIDRFMVEARGYIINFGRTGEKFVDGKYEIYVQE